MRPQSVFEAAAGGQVTKPADHADFAGDVDDAAGAFRALRMLSACLRALTRIDDEAALLSEICRIVVEIGGYRLAGVGYAMDDAERSLQLMAVAGDHPEHAAAMRLSWDPDSPYGQGPAGRAVRSGEPLAYTDFNDAQQNFPGRVPALAMGYQSAITLPLRAAGAGAGAAAATGRHSFGFLGLFSGQITRMRPGELALLQELADSIAFAILAARDRAEGRRAAAELAYNASHDAVTGLQRYSALAPQLEPLLAAADAFVALLVVDLDRFKDINESIGHAAADGLLRTIAQRLQTLAGPDIDVARFAGDEFVVALRGGDEAASTAFTERLRAVLAAPIDDGRISLQLTATVGISHAPAHGRNPLELLLRAQAAKDVGKAIGRDCVSLFRTEQMQDIEDRVTLGGRLRGALRAGELQLHYQVQTAADARTVTGFEALLRWNAAGLGPVSPARFVPIAEALGLMPEIGGWVLAESCRQARAWLDAGHRDFRVAVNVSAQQLQRPGLVAAVAAALAAAELPPAMLDIELTESSLMENIGRVRDTLAELKALGVGMSLDDFGTGYSSLAYLKHFPLDKLKIDRSFVRALPDGRADATIARTIVALGHHLGMRVSAEGVETQEQATFLAGIGCDELQGFLMGRPEPADDAGRRLAPQR
jgi:diguanylate cyclase (GGDEF)-like protein